MKKTYLFLLILNILILMLAGCMPTNTQVTASATSNPNENTSSENMLSNNDVATKIAGEISVKSTQIAGDLEAEFQDKVNTAVAFELTLIALEATATPTAQPLENTPIPTAVQLLETPTPTVEPVANPSLDYHAQFIDDVSVPDGTVFVAGDSFTKTWRIRNIGKEPWTTEFSFVFINKDRMDGEAIFLPREVPSGGTIDISIPMIAPGTAGTYTGYWGFQTPDDVIFGIGKDANEYIYVTIDVVAPTATPTPTSTPTP